MATRVDISEPNRVLYGQTFTVQPHLVTKGTVMATGITRREQHSLDAVSALDLGDEPFPLPGGNGPATLQYPNKIPEDFIVDRFARQFASLEDSRALPLDEIPDNSFVLGDNFFVLNKLLHDSKKVALFYLDPPFGTGFDFHSRSLEHSYKDRMGQLAYLEFMRRRLVLMRECMADDGSIYMHIDHRMLAHLKVLMDELFGAENFRNLITRRKCSSKNFTRKQYPNLNDYVLFYSKGKQYKWNQPGVAPKKQWIEREYPKVDNIGRRFKLVPVHAPGTRKGETGKPWRGVLPPPGKHWQYAPSKLDEFDRRGDIHWSRNGNPRRKIYWSSDKTMALTDYWDGYRDAHHQSVMVTGYPTEKNFNMLKMIVAASSNCGDLVVDPFCGSGTTLHAARDLGRRYIGVDASFEAAKATLTRMRHGMEPMGSYVCGRDTASKGSPSRKYYGIRTPCAFVVDRRLVDEHQATLREICAI